MEPGTPELYRFDIYARVSGLGPNESFGLVGYDMTFSPGFTRNSLNIGGASTGLTNPKPNYVADNPTTPLVVSASGQPLTNYYTGGQNGDLGSSTTDLVGMLTAIDASNLDGLEDGDGVHATDPRLAIGTNAGGTRIGAIYLRWDGVTNARFTLVNCIGATANRTTKLFSETFPITTLPFVFPLTPPPNPAEPSSFVLAGLAGVGIVLFRRKRNRSKSEESSALKN
jgi:hypothetical protein